MQLFRLSILFIFFLTDYLKFGLGINHTANICLILMLLDVFNTSVNRKQINVNLILPLILPLIFLFSFSILMWDSYYTVYSYIGLIPVIWILTSIKFHNLKMFFKFFLFINLLIAFYEYINQTFIYESIAERNGDFFELSYDEISGNVIRAKALFPGPLTLANLALGAAFLFPRDKILLVIAILLCFLSNARLGLLCTSIIYLNYHLRLNFTSIFLVTVIIYILTYVIDNTGLLRILDVFNVNANNHISRIYFMKSALELFVEYDFVHMLFGNSGQLLARVGNNAESGWLTLLVENGLLGLAFYLYYILVAIKKTVFLKDSNSLIIILLFFVMSVQTYYLSILGPIVYWLPVLKETKTFKLNYNV